MMRKSLIPAALAAVVLILFSGCERKPDSAKPFAAKPLYHIGIVTGSDASTADDAAGAARLVKEYGDVKNGGMIQYETYPENWAKDRESTVALIAGFADDPLMKAVVVSRAIPGTSEAFSRIRQKRSDVLLFAGGSMEAPLAIESEADLAVNPDFIAGGYAIAWTAKQLGAQRLVRVSFPRWGDVENEIRLVAVLKQASADLGLDFALETSPDTASFSSADGIRKFVADKTAGWIEKYGPVTAFSCADAVASVPLAQALLPGGGIFLGNDRSSSLLGYPEVFGLDSSKDGGDFPGAMKKLEAAVVKAGGSGRFSARTYPEGFGWTAALGELARRVVDGKAKKDEIRDFSDCLGKYAPGVAWRVSYYVDPVTGVRAKNHILVDEDAYVFGKGPLGSSRIEVPNKYSLIAGK
jgi:hypothetical protein